MILVADSGSTKCDWILIDKEVKSTLKIKTKGINPILISKQEISNIVNESEKLNIIKSKVSKIHFFAAGCGTEGTKKILKAFFKNFFFNASEINIEEDLTAAIHGTTNKPGVICILGTGSNCCYYDGDTIFTKQVSLGYSVMDEGSGNYFGKKLLNAFFYKKMPQHLHNKFLKEHETNLGTILDGLYKSENPSAFLANYARFLVNNKNEPFICNIIENGLEVLFSNLIMCYKEELKKHSLHFVGSIGYLLQNEIIKKAREYNINIKSFVKSPIDNIVQNLKLD
jgi:N-acetylglucosamine kinase-like BadF-type ATPase